MDGSIYTHIAKNKRDTFFIMLSFIIIISAIGWLIGEFWAGDGVFFTGIALVFSGLSSFFSYYYSDKLVLNIVKAQEVKPEDSEYLHNLVENLSIASGLPKPKIYITPDRALNAFATGRDPEHAVICVTQGIVETLDKRELEGVLAHEMSHIGNYDIRLMSIVTVLVGTVALMSDWFTRGIVWGGGSRRSNSRSDGGGSGIMLIVGILLLVLSPIVATLIKLAVSRNREYLADATGAMITRNPHALASALTKISQSPMELAHAHNATAHMYISNPFKNGQLANLFSTHPPAQERIRRLMSM